MSLRQFLCDQLNQYCISNGRNDYPKEDGIGLLLRHLQEEGIETDTVEEELDDDDVDNCGFIDFDYNFPINGAQTDQRDFLYQKLKEFLQIHRQRKKQPLTAPTPSVPITQNPTPQNPPNSTQHKPSTDTPNVITDQSSSGPLMTRIDRGLRLKYQSMGLQYDNEHGIGKFIEYCTDNGYDEESIPTELDPNDKTNCGLLDFDDDFPFKGDEDQRTEFIFDLLYGLYLGDSTNPILTESDIVREEPSDSDDSKDPDDTNISNVDRICSGMSEYYKSHKAPYNNIVSTYCNENGYSFENIEDSDDLKDELPDLLLSTFPFKGLLQGAGTKRKRAHIWDLILSFVHNARPGTLPPEIHSVIFLEPMLHSVTGKDFKRSRERYKSQCPAMWRREMQIDHGFMFALAVGDKYGFPFLQFLVDDYLCTKANRRQFPNGLSVRDWASTQNRYLMMLKEHKVRVQVEWEEQYIDPDPRNGGRGQIQKEMQTLRQSAWELIVHAVISWSKRCVQDWKPTQYRIDEPMNEVMEMYSDFVRWIVVNIMGNWEKYEHTSCPMQLDISFVFDPKKVVNQGIESVFSHFQMYTDGAMLCLTVNTKRFSSTFCLKITFQLSSNHGICLVVYTENNGKSKYEDDSDDDDVGDEFKLNRGAGGGQRSRVPIPKNIGAVLEQSGTKYLGQSEVKPRDTPYRAQNLFLNFLKKYDRTDLDKNGNHFMHRKRLNVIVDRRETKTDTIWFVYLLYISVYF